jgi:hypothetical protein
MTRTVHCAALMGVCNWPQTCGERGSCAYTLPAEPEPEDDRCGMSCAFGPHPCHSGVCHSYGHCMARDAEDAGY